MPRHSGVVGVVEGCVGLEECADPMLRVERVGCGLELWDGFVNVGERRSGVGGWDRTCTSHSRARIKSEEDAVAMAKARKAMEG